jgi:hypothetical protein
MRHLIAALALALAACTGAPPPAPIREPLVLTGTITRADHQTYREIPFTVPPGTTRIAVDFTYDKDNRTVIDLGLRDPQGQRGWSGGNKSSFEIGEHQATPSYRPGPLQPGEWKLILGIPNIRDGQTSSYTATVTLSSETANPDARRVAPATKALVATPGWFRGDLHTHTAHSDGSCGPEGARIPCPAQHTADATRNAGLDFVAITDHNTITQLADIKVLQATYPATLLIPGTEITTFNGHANVIGNTDFLDFQLGSPRLPTLAKLFDQVDAANAFLSINHPSLPSGEVCMSCGWTAKDVDWSRVAAIEVINGSTLRTSGAEAPMSGIKFWEDRLREGHRLTAIGGSDNHDATDATGARQSPIGKPATVVHASELSTAGIIAGVKSGRVFIDVAGLPTATLDMTAQSGASMGDQITLQAGERTTVSVAARNTPTGAQLEIVAHNLDVAEAPASPAGDQIRQVSLANGASSGWVRANVRDAAGKLLLLGNPIYIRRTPAG